MSRPTRYLFVFVLLFFAQGVCGSLFSQSKDYKSYSLFIYNFIKYIEWPDINDPFVIGVVGDSPIIKELEQMAQNKKAKGKQIIIKKLNAPAEASACHLVFLPGSKSSQLKSLNEVIKGKGILLVAEREGLAKKGAAISFATLDDDTLKFEYNPGVVDQNRLKIPTILAKLGFQI